MTKNSILPFFSLWKSLTLLTVVFLNFWIWKIIQTDLTIAILLVVITFLLFQLIVGKYFRLLILILIVLFLFLSFSILRSGFDKKIQTVSPDDEVKLNDRHLYYSQELGSLFLNRKVLNYYKNYSLTLYKFEGNLFSNLDLNLYFFASHPRERIGVSEFEKFSPLFLPFFITGVIALIYSVSVWAGIYLIVAALISAFIDQNYLLGPILFFPLIAMIITIGLINFLRFVKDFRTKFL